VGTAEKLHRALVLVQQLQPFRHHIIRTSYDGFKKPYPAAALSGTTSRSRHAASHPWPFGMPQGLRLGRIDCEQRLFLCTQCQYTIQGVVS
jgi:hypothetical protein